MNLGSFKERLDNNPKLKRLIHNMIVHPVKARPRWWMRALRCFYIKRGCGSVIYRSVRLDVVPFNRFSLGRRSVLEAFSAVNNGVGDVTIGDRCHVGINNIIIGPVEIGDGFVSGQNVLIVGLDHHFEDIHKSIHDQGVTVHPIVIGADAFIGANSVVMASVGRHSVVGAGSVVTRAVPDYCFCAGSPARIIKHYDFESGEWVKGVPGSFV